MTPKMADIAALRKTSNEPVDNAGDSGEHSAQIKHAQKHNKVYVPGYTEVGAKDENEARERVREILSKQGVTDSTEQDELFDRANSKITMGYTFLPRKKKE